MRSIDKNNKLKMLARIRAAIEQYNEMHNGVLLELHVFHHDKKVLLRLRESCSDTKHTH